MKTIAVIAGEDSGERLAAEYVRCLRKVSPDLQIIGVGEERLASEGVDLILRSSDLSVVGLTEVIRQYPRLRKQFHRVRRAILEANVDLLVTFDFPGFNLRLAGKASAQGIPTLHVVSPQIWAWRAWRIRSLRSSVNELVVLFPFEVEFYQRHRMKVHFFGHPVIERLERERPERRRKAAELRRLDPRPIIAYLPGSRTGELHRHLPVIADTIRALGPEGYRHVISSVPGVDPQLYTDVVERTGCELYGGSDVLLEAASAALVKSGTSTFEAMGIGVPFAVIYRVSPVTAFVARRLAKVDHLAMPNIIAGDEIVHEFLQEEMTPELLAAEVQELITPERSEELRVELSRLVARSFLGPGRSLALEGEMSSRLARFTVQRFLSDANESVESVR